MYKKYFFALISITLVILSSCKIDMIIKDVIVNKDNINAFCETVFELSKMEHDYFQTNKTNKAKELYEAYYVFSEYSIGYKEGYKQINNGSIDLVIAFLIRKNIFFYDEDILIFERKNNSNHLIKEIRIKDKNISIYRVFEKSMKL